MWRGIPSIRIECRLLIPVTRPIRYRVVHRFGGGFTHTRPPKLYISYLHSCSGRGVVVSASYTLAIAVKGDRSSFGVTLYQYTVSIIEYCFRAAIRLRLRYHSTIPSALYVSWLFLARVFDIHLWTHAESVNKCNQHASSTIFPFNSRNIPDARELAPTHLNSSIDTPLDPYGVVIFIPWWQRPWSYFRSGGGASQYGAIHKQERVLPIFHILKILFSVWQFQVLSLPRFHASNKGYPSPWVLQA